MSRPSELSCACRSSSPLGSGAGALRAFLAASLATLLSAIPTVASGAPKAPCDEDDAARGTVTEWPLAASTDGSRVALLSRFVPSNLVCGLEQTQVIVREVESGKALWSARWTGAVPSRAERPALDQLVPAEVRARHGLVSPAPAALSFPDIAHRSARGANDRVARGIRADGGPFEIALPGVSDTLQEAWILDDRVLLVFAVSASSQRGERDTFAFVSLPIRAQLSPAAYEALRARVAAAPSAREALRLIADEAYRDAANPFVAAALVGQLSPPPTADDAPEAYLAAVADLTLYLSKMKEAGAGCVDIATSALANPRLRAPALSKVRSAVEHNLRLCRQYVHPSAG